MIFAAGFYRAELPRELKRNGVATTKRVLLFLGLCLGLVGCVHPERSLDASLIRELKVGQDQSEVRKILGQPQRTRADSSGKLLDIYLKDVPVIRGGPNVVNEVELRSIFVLYNPEGEVTQFTHHIGKLRGIPGGYRAGVSKFEDKVAEIERGSTTREELIEVFGPAHIEGLSTSGKRIMVWFSLEGGNSLYGEKDVTVTLDSDSVTLDYFVEGNNL